VAMVVGSLVVRRGARPWRGSLTVPMDSSSLPPGFSSVPFIPSEVHFYILLRSATFIPSRTRRHERGSRWRIKDREIGPISPIVLSLFSATSSSASTSFCKLSGLFVGPPNAARRMNNRLRVCTYAVHKPNTKSFSHYSSSLSVCRYDSVDVLMLRECRVPIVRLG
jgi:hypothetical protein